MKTKILGLLAVGLLAGPAVATTMTCGSGATISTAQVDTAATCQSWGNNSSYSQIWGVATTIAYTSVNMDLVAFGGQTLGTALNNSEPFQSPLQIANLSPAQSYLVLLYEASSQTAQDWMVVTVLGQEIINGLEYVKASSSNTAKYEIRVFNSPPPQVPEPGTLALLGLGLAGLGLSRRRKAV